MSWLADKIEQWPTGKLLPYARNARTHSEEQVAQIAASIAEFGFTNPILAGSDGIIVAGHGRLAAAQKLGLERVPVVVLDHLTPTQRRALVIADNRIAENAGWDDAMLRIELEALQLDGFDLDITGFDADALAELIAGDEPDNEGQTDEDAVPEVSETPISRPGDVWNIKKPQKNDLHPTMKPVELVERAIRNSSRPGNVVLDPFGGSGTTLIAAEKAGRIARLIELDPKYVDVIVRRWEKFTGNKGVLAGGSTTFEEVTLERAENKADGPEGDPGDGPAVPDKRRRARPARGPG